MCQFLMMLIKASTVYWPLSLAILKGNYQHCKKTVKINPLKLELPKNPKLNIRYFKKASPVRNSECLTPDRLVRISTASAVNNPIKHRICFELVPREQ